MASKFSNYSRHRRAIMGQVRRLEGKGFKVSDKYHLPTVAQLRKMSEADQKQIMRSAYGMKTSAVRKSAYRIAGKSTKTGKLQAKRVNYAEFVRENRVTGAKQGVVTRRKNRDQDEDFEVWAQNFIDEAPLSDKMNAEAYVQEVREGRDVGSYEEYLVDLGEEPSAKETFSAKMSNLDELSPEVADWLRKLYEQSETEIGSEAMNETFAKVQEIPDFDTPYEGKGGTAGVSYQSVVQMAQIIKGRPLSGAQYRSLGLAMQKDEYK